MLNLRIQYDRLHQIEEDKLDEEAYLNNQRREINIEADIQMRNRERSLEKLQGRVDAL